MNTMQIGDQVIVRHALDGIVYTIEDLYDEKLQVAEQAWRISPVAELLYQEAGQERRVVIPLSRLRKPYPSQLAAKG